MQIQRVSDDLLTIRYEAHNLVREVHMGQTEFPANVSPSRMGYSIGEQKLVQERYSLSPDGKSMDVAYTFSDPEYLTGPPIEKRGAYVLRNSIVLSDYQCDPNAAVRHLTGQ